jgi:hypothetical protein
VNLEFYPTLETLPFSDADKAKALMWLARKIWDAQQRHDQDYHCKRYDPLQIHFNDDGTIEVDSYVFSFREGGRHHSFSDLDDLEQAVLNELFSIMDLEIQEAKTAGCPGHD